LSSVRQEEIQRLFAKLDADARKNGYFLNPDSAFTRELAEGLLANEKRFGHQACPCRLADGVRQEDLDIICPCDYRDADLNDFGACYCALYVSKDIAEGKASAEPLPDRRPVKRDERAQNKEKKVGAGASELSHPVWRCRVCGYLAARDEPPGVCPICKATKDRFDRFM
jgi:ferredoxin-thioredoxin reductase catalytic chain